MMEDAMGNYIEVTDATFEEEVLKSKLPVLVDFWAVWCAPCRMIAPMVEELATEKEGSLKVAKMDVDNNPDTAMKFGIRSIPTLLIFKDGQIVDQVVGAVPKSMLESKVEKHI
jgi:thioredoxin 1